MTTGAVLSDRNRRILTGLITICLVSAAVVYGIRRANGALRPRYRVTAEFTAASSTSALSAGRVSLA